MRDAALPAGRRLRVPRCGAILEAGGVFRALVDLVEMAAENTPSGAFKGQGNDGCGLQVNTMDWSS